MKTLAALLICLVLLTGCASFSQAYSGYQQSAIAGLQMANDNVISTWTATACATPLSAVYRNPQVIPALKALCMPGGAAVSPATLLDSISAGKGAP